MQKEKRVYAQEVEASLESMESGLEGLSLEEVRRRQETFGSNTIERKQGRTLWQLILGQFADVLILLLLVATVVSALLGEYIDATAMMSIVLLSAVLGFVQEFRAEQAVEALQKLTTPQAKVLRGGQVTMVASPELVPGDLVLLAAGDLVPADARLVEVHQLKVDEASLTGESISVKKHTEALDEKALVSEQRNMVFLGTSVVHGEGRAVVSSIGMQTEMGHIARSIQETEQQKTPLQVKFERVARQIGLVVVGLIVLVFLATLWSKPETLAWKQYMVNMLIFSLSLAVAAVPSSLPAIVTIGLAMGTKALARKKMIIKRLPAAESLGSVTAICSDKTGTLTKNQMTVTRLYADGQLVEVTGTGYTPEGSFLVEADGQKQPKEVQELSLPLRIGALCNNAVLEEKEGSVELVGDPTEGALRVVAMKAFGEEPFADFVRHEEHPFDSERKLMSVVMETPDGSFVSYVKGAPDVLLERSVRLWEGGESRALTEEDRVQLAQVNEGLASEALRVLGVAFRPLDGKSAGQEECEEGLTLVGLFGMLDPPREEVAEAIEKARGAGIRVMMITGDHALTAGAVARQIGLGAQEDRVLTGHALEEMDDATLQEEIESVRIIARALPAHKLRVVKALQARGHIVAMTGDGVNDAPALKRADIGVAMGTTGTDVVKEVSEAIVVDDNFVTIVKAVEEGRNIYDKMLKSMRYLLSCNAGEILVVFFAVLSRFPLPLLPLQILLMNLVTDGLPALALGVEPIDKDAMNRPPRRPDANPLNTQTLLLILIFGLVMGAGTLYLFVSYQGEGLTKARSVAFTTLVMFEMFAVLGARSLRPFSTLNPLTNLWLLLAVCSSVGLQLLLLYVPALQKVFATTALGWQEWIWILAIASLGFIVMEVSKLFIKDEIVTLEV